MKFDQDLCGTCDINSTLGSVVPLAMFMYNPLIQRLNFSVSLCFRLLIFGCDSLGGLEWEAFDKWPGRIFRDRNGQLLL